MTDYDEFMSRLNPKTAALFTRASEIENEYLMTPSLGININTGGLRYGAIHTLWGNRSAGKTQFCLGLVAEAQKHGKICAWVDAEKNFDPRWARRNGVDTDRLGVSHTTDMVSTANSAVELVQAGVDLLVIDSMSVLLPQSYFADGEIKGLEGTNQIGTFSKNFASMVNMLNNVNKNTCIVIISQVRNKFHQHGASKSLMGGEAAEFMNSTIIKLWAPLTDKETITDKINFGELGDLILDKPVGRPVTWTITKARGPGMGVSNTYNLMFEGDDVGIDLNSEIVSYGTEYGVIKKSGNWLSYNDEQVKTNGKDNFIKELKNNPEVAQDIYDKIMGRIKA